MPFPFLPDTLLVISLEHTHAKEARPLDLTSVMAGLEPDEEIVADARAAITFIFLCDSLTTSRRRPQHLASFYCSCPT